MNKSAELKKLFLNYYLPVVIQKICFWTIVPMLYENNENQQLNLDKTCSGAWQNRTSIILYEVTSQGKRFGLAVSRCHAKPFLIEMCLFELTGCAFSPTPLELMKQLV